MAWGPGREPKFERTSKTLEEVKADPLVSNYFVEFLLTLDMSKTAIFYENDQQSHSGTHGYRVVHFNKKVEEKWHDTWGVTWHGTGCWMS